MKRAKKYWHSITHKAKGKRQETPGGRRARLIWQVDGACAARCQHENIAASGGRRGRSTAGATPTRIIKPIMTYAAGSRIERVSLQGQHVAGISMASYIRSKQFYLTSGGSNL